MGLIQANPTGAVRFGSARANVLTIVPRHTYPETAAPGDRDLLDAQVELSSGGFRASFQIWLKVSDLVRFREHLTRLYDQLVGSVEFSTPEDQLRLRLVGDGRGHLVLNGTALDRPASSNRLDFRFEIDQTDLHEALVALGDLV